MLLSEYMGFKATFKFDSSGNVYHGEVVGIRDVIFFEAESLEQLEREFRTSIDDYLRVCAERGRAPWQ